MIYVARHGQTQYNVDGKICGHADIELTEVGYAQAEELAQLVSDLEQPITKIYVSPLRRAQETARIINEKVSVQLKHRNSKMFVWNSRYHYQTANPSWMLPVGCILCWQSWNKVTKMFCWCVTMP